MRKLWWNLRIWRFHVWMLFRGWMAYNLCYEFLGEAYLKGWYAGIAQASADYEQGLKDGELQALEDLGYAAPDPIRTPESPPMTSQYGDLYNEL